MGSGRQKCLSMSPPLIALTMKGVWIGSVFVAMALLLSITSFPTAYAARSSVSSVTGSGEWGFLGIILCLKKTFDLSVSGKQPGAGAATGTYIEECVDLVSDRLTVSIDTIVSISDTAAHVKGQVSMTSLGVSNCVDSNGNPVTHVLLNLEVTEGGVGVGSVHEFGELPPGITGEISCTDAGEPVGLILQNVDFGVQPLTEGSIVVDDGI